MDFIEEFNHHVDNLDLSWDIYGLIDRNDKIYSLTTDAKIIGRVFELLAAPAIRALAEDNGYEIEPADSQTIYPDYTLEKDSTDDFGVQELEKGDKILELDGESINTRSDIEDIIEPRPDDNPFPCVVERDGNQQTLNTVASQFQKIAVDVKTTYRKFYKRKYQEFEAGDTRPFGYTLGSYASFLREFTKNIQYDYRSYQNSFVIGFIYTRNSALEEGLVEDYECKEDIVPPFVDIEYFVQEKYKIAGETPGSGNTENIGSFKTNDINELREGNGPFAEFGKETFKDYWRNYGRYREVGDYTNLEEYFDWKEAD